MKNWKFGKGIGEGDRKDKIKLYKAGKHWVTRVLSKIGLVKLYRSSNEQVSQAVTDELAERRTQKILKTIALSGTVFGGVSVADKAFAAENTTQYLNSETLAGTDSVEVDLSDSADGSSDSIAQAGTIEGSQVEASGTVSDASVAQATDTGTSKNFSKNL